MKKTSLGIQRREQLNSFVEVKTMTGTSLIQPCLLLVARPWEKSPNWFTSQDSSVFLSLIWGLHLPCGPGVGLHVVAGSASTVSNMLCTIHGLLLLQPLSFYCFYWQNRYCWCYFLNYGRSMLVVGKGKESVQVQRDIKENV